MLVDVVIEKGTGRNEDAGDWQVEPPHELVLGHLWLADALARRYRGRGMEADELQQEARSALVEAAQRFDPSVGPFAPFAAATISGMLKRCFRDHGWGVRPPRHLQQLSVQIRSEWSAAAQDVGHEPTRHDLATRLGESALDIDLALRAGLNYRTASLDDDSRAVFSAASLDPGFLACESRLLLDRLLPQLEASERRLIRARFWDERSQTEIAQDLGVSQMQVSRLLVRALTHLRQLYADGDPTLALPAAASRPRRRRSPKSAQACACQGAPDEGSVDTDPAPASAA